MNIGGATGTSTEGLTDSLDLYEHLLNQLRTVTHSDDIDAIIKRFNQLEDQNFSLFNYVNEVSADVELEEETLSVIQKSIDNVSERNMQSDTERQGELRAIEVKFPFL